jgi:hypothetical protein
MFNEGWNDYPRWRLWVLACAWAGIDPSVMHAIFSPANPYAASLERVESAAWRGTR